MQILYKLLQKIKQMMQPITTPAINPIKPDNLVTRLIQLVEQHLIKKEDPKITLFYLYELFYTGPHISHKLSKLQEINTSIPLNQAITQIKQEYPTAILNNHHLTERFNTTLNTITIREEEIGHSNVDPEDFPFKTLNNAQQQTLIDNELATTQYIYKIHFRKWKNEHELRPYRQIFVDLYNFLWEMSYIKDHQAALSYFQYTPGSDFLHTNLAILRPSTVEKLSRGKLHDPQANNTNDKNMIYFFGKKELFTTINQMINEISKGQLYIIYLQNVEDIPERWPYYHQAITSVKLPVEYQYELNYTFLEIVSNLGKLLFTHKELVDMPSIEPAFKNN